MLSRLFKKRDGVDTPKAEPTPLVTPESKARQAEEALALWQPRLQSAQGDDAALLLIAQTAPVLDIKLAAVEALTTEDALKQAERELRSHDSRVHRAAKKRHVAAVAQREARARAQELVLAAATLANETPLPANRLVALDRDWQALNTDLLTPEQRAEFTAVRERLNALLHEEGEAQQRLQREQREQLEQARLAAEAQQAQAEQETRLAELAAQSPPQAESEVEPEAAQASETPPPLRVPKALNNEQRQHLDGLLGQAEAALAEGQLVEMQQQLQTIDAALDALQGVSIGDRLRARHQALHAERARLKGWQQWGGARALDDLVGEAEALAQRTLAAAGTEVAKPAKLHLKAHADSIHALRTRWKEIDRVGAPVNQALWHRFDAALQTAYQPVAAQQAALKAARQENLQAREALLATLDAVPMAEPPAEADALAAHWKELLRALNQFQLAWRQLGPLEHTVPSAAKKALQQRFLGSVERIEAPLNEARRVAQAEREQLVARAEALVESLNRNQATRDAVPRVRELQSEWQQHARTLPLARAAENALWARFKAATDAVFVQREAAFSARDAELAANLAAREALIASLTSLDLSAAPVSELQRALGEADRSWREAVEVPRASVKDLDTRFHDACASVVRAVGESEQRRWQQQCDVLAAKLALCAEREESGTAGTGAMADRWAALGALPAAWEKPLAQRWAQDPAPGPLSELACDELLLQLEAAFDLPASPEQLAARREMKLRALKEALEGRKAQPQDPATQRAEWLVVVLRQAGLTSDQRQRLHLLLGALRRSPS